MGYVNHVHGTNEPFAVFREARAKGEKAEFPDYDEDDVDLYGMAGEIARDDKFPEFQAVFWLLAPKGRGRSSMHIDLQGNTSPNLNLRRFGLGTPGVKVSNLNRRELDAEEFMREQISLGWVRVDHLKNADGERLGVPTQAVWQDRIKWRDWCWQALDPARLEQLKRELEASEEGRTLLADWDPKVPTRVVRKLSAHKNKTRAEIAEGKAVIDVAQTYLDKAAAKFRAGVTGTAPPPPPKGKASESTPVEMGLAILDASKGDMSREDAAAKLDADLKITDLRDVADALGVSKSGSKAALIDALLTHAQG